MTVFLDVILSANDLCTAVDTTTPVGSALGAKWQWQRVNSATKALGQSLAVWRVIASHCSAGSSPAAAKQGARPAPRGILGPRADLRPLSAFYVQLATSRRFNAGFMSRLKEIIGRLL